MRFRRKGILFWEVQIVVSLCLIGSIALMVYDSMFISVLLIPSVLLVGAFVMQLISRKEYIIMNEEGIACQIGKQLRWGFQWSEIAELKIGNRFRNPSVDIVIKTDCCNNKGKIETIEAYFQLGLAAKKAIKHYCKCPITKIN